MQAIMLGLSSVPGVMGGMLSDERGTVLAHSFPPYFDADTIKGAANMLQDNTVGLQDVTGGVRLFDIRCELGRLIIKTMPQMFVVVLCQPAVNVQLLMISLNVAIKKLEKLSIDHPLAQPPRQMTPQPQPLQKAGAIPHPVSTAPAGNQPAPEAGGIFLTLETMKGAKVLFGVDSASVNSRTAHAISDHFDSGPFKKLTITNVTNGIKKLVVMSIVPHDRDGVYDGKISPSKCLLESLQAKEGDQIRVESVHGGGLFG